MPVYIGDYLADTMGLTTEQHGAYFLLLLYGWKSNGDLPKDDVQLASISRLPLEKWLKNKSEIMQFFTESETSFFQKRQIIELKNALSRRKSASENGKKGGRPSRRRLTHK
jgi:uncharacterized protein YdaU (DUF1376 family)